MSDKKNEKESHLQSGTGEDNFEFTVVPPSYEMPHRSDYDAGSHAVGAYVPYRGQMAHGVDAPLERPLPPDLRLEKFEPGTRAPDTVVRKPEPIDVRVISTTTRREIIRPRMYVVNVPPPKNPGSYGASTPLFGRDLSRDRWWVCSNVKATFNVFLNDVQDVNSGFPIPGGFEMRGPFLSQDSVWAFSNSDEECQVFVYLEYTSDL